MIITVTLIKDIFRFFSSYTSLFVTFDHCIKKFTGNIKNNLNDATRSTDLEVTQMEATLYVDSIHL